MSGLLNLVALAADAVLAFVSGFPLILLGATLLAIRPWRRQQVFFGAFSVLWGAQVVTANLGRVFCDAALHATSLLIAHGFMVVATLFLMHFAVMTAGGGKRSWITAATGVVAVGALVTYLVDPGLLVVGATATDCALRTTYGPLLYPLIQIPFHLAFVIGILLLNHSYRRARPGTARFRLRGIILALALFASYQFVRNALAFLDLHSFAEFASGAVRASNDLSTDMLVFSFIGGALLLGGLAVYNVRRPPPPEDPDVPLLFAFLGPAVVAVAEHLFAVYGIMQLETLGFWRLVSVGVLVYTLAHHQLFDLDLRLKRLAGPGTATVLILFGIPFVLSLAQGELGREAALITLVPEFIGVGAVLIFRNRIGERLFPGVRENATYLHERRLELYRVALEDAIARGQDPDGRGLVTIRSRFGVTEEEHRLLLWVVRGSSHARKSEDATLLGSGDVVLGRYRLERTIGGRSTRETFLATDIRARQHVVVKAVALDSLDGAAAAILLREARLAATISHPNVLAIFDVAEEGNHVLLVMDYAELGNLNDLLTTRHRLDPAAAVRLLSELLAGLQAVHERGIVHGNLKPENLLMDADGSVLIADFGAATAKGAEPAGAHHDLARGMLFDPLYLSPEQIRAEGGIDPRSDLYVAAVIFHTALTGRYPLPITGRSDLQIRYLVQEHEPELHLEKATEWAKALLQKALAKSPDARYRDAAEMRADLHRRAGLPVVQTATRST